MNKQEAVIRLQALPHLRSFSTYPPPDQEYRQGLLKLIEAYNKDPDYEERRNALIPMATLRANETCPYDAADGKYTAAWSKLFLENMQRLAKEKRV